VFGLEMSDPDRLFSGTYMQIVPTLRTMYITESKHILDTLHTGQPVPVGRPGSGVNERSVQSLCHEGVQLLPLTLVIERLAVLVCSLVQSWH
jgi:hypothetical protein